VIQQKGNMEPRKRTTGAAIGKANGI